MHSSGENLEGEGKPPQLTEAGERAQVAWCQSGVGRGRTHGRADLHIDAPEQRWVTYQC